MISPNEKRRPSASDLIKRFQERVDTTAEAPLVVSNRFGSPGKPRTSLTSTSKLGAAGVADLGNADETKAARRVSALKVNSEAVKQQEDNSPVAILPLAFNLNIPSSTDDNTPDAKNTLGETTEEPEKSIDDLDMRMKSVELDLQDGPTKFSKPASPQTAKETQSVPIPRDENDQPSFSLPSLSPLSFDTPDDGMFSPFARDNDLRSASGGTEDKDTNFLKRISGSNMKDSVPNSVGSPSSSQTVQLSESQIKRDAAATSRAMEAEANAEKSANPHRPSRVITGGVIKPTLSSLAKVKPPVSSSKSATSPGKTRREITTKALAGAPKQAKDREERGRGIGGISAVSNGYSVTSSPTQSGSPALSQSSSTFSATPSDLSSNHNVETNSGRSSSSRSRSIAKVTSSSTAVSSIPLNRSPSSKKNIVDRERSRKTFADGGRSTETTSMTKKGANGQAEINKHIKDFEEEENEKIFKGIGHRAYGRIPIPGQVSVDDQSKESTFTPFQVS